jgi:hypothetical protein
MHAQTAAVSFTAVAKGSSIMQALNIIAPLAGVTVIGAAAYLLQRWWRRRHPAARPEEDSSGWTSQHPSGSHERSRRSAQLRVKQRVPSMRVLVIPVEPTRTQRQACDLTNVPIPLTLK